MVLTGLNPRPASARKPSVADQFPHPLPCAGCAKCSRCTQLFATTSQPEPLLWTVTYLYCAVSA